MRSKQKKYKFSKGEVNERLLERQDLELLESSASYIKNMVSTPFGSIRTRGGTENIAVASTNLLAVTEPTITSYAGDASGVAVPAEMVAYWKLDETTGNALDSFASYDVTENGTVPANTGLLVGARGPYTTANFFRRADASATTVFDNDLFLAEAWVKTSVTGAFQRIIGKQPSAQNAGWQMEIRSDNKAYLTFSGDLIAGNASVCDGNWHYIVVGQRASSGASERRLYVDGVKQTDDGIGALFTSDASELTIGLSGSGATAHVQGLICECAYHSLAASSKSWSDIETDIITPRYNAGAGKRYAV